MRMFFKKSTRRLRRIPGDFRSTFPFCREEKRHKYIFFHVPKNAGSAIRKAMGYQFGGRLHLPWYAYYSADPEFFLSAYKFAVVRNPWDRVVSSYLYLANGGNGTSDLNIARALSEYEHFSDFIQRGLSQGQFRSNLMFLPQANFLMGPAGEIMVDKLVQYENLETGISEVARHIPILSTEVPTVNASSRRKDYKSYYDCTEVVEAVGELYKEDAISFGYSYGEGFEES